MVCISASVSTSCELCTGLSATFFLFLTHSTTREKPLAAKTNSTNSESVMAIIVDEAEGLECAGSSPGGGEKEMFGIIGGVLISAGSSPVGGRGRCLVLLVKYSSLHV